MTDRPAAAAAAACCAVCPASWRAFHESSAHADVVSRLPRQGTVHTAAWRGHPGRAVPAAAAAHLKTTQTFVLVLNTSTIVFIVMLLPTL